MLIVMDKNVTPPQVDEVVNIIESLGYVARPIPGGDRVAIGVLYNKGAIDKDRFSALPGVKEVIRVTKSYKLVSREFKPENSIIELDDIKIGSNQLITIAGPCAVESEKQSLSIAKEVKKAGAKLFRGGAYKPRSSPYSFQGLKEEGLKILAKVREETGLYIVTEALDNDSFNIVEEYTDIIQIGARNMQNFSLLRRAGLSKKPVLLKRGISSTIEEWLMAAEYILEAGNQKVILCERGVRTFATHNRNTLDLSAIPVVLKESHLPIIVDPSHAAGKRDLVVPLARAAIAAGACGIIVEVHNHPEKALSDGAQSLYPEQFKKMYDQIETIHEVLKKSI